MDVELLHSAIRQCEADCDHIEKLLVNLLAQSKPRPGARVRKVAADQSLRRLLSGLDETTSVWLRPCWDETQLGSAPSCRRD